MNNSVERLLSALESTSNNIMKLGFTLSPGGLLLPYHVGALEALQYNGFLTDETPLAGSSAGAIAVAAHAAGVPHKHIVEATIGVSNQCRGIGARGNLLRCLKDELSQRIQDNEFERLQQRPGLTGIAYREVLPRYRDVLQTEFDSRDDLIQAVLSSSHFPFFATNWPVLWDRVGNRLVVDGYFTVPRERFGCPELDVERTVAISVFPKDRIRLTAVEDCISPPEDSDLGRLFALATESSSAEDLWRLYEMGWENAESWCRSEVDLGALN